MAVTNIERFVRFNDENGLMCYGELASAAVSKGDQVTLLAGDPFAGLSRTKDKAIVKEV